MQRITKSVVLAKADNVRAVTGKNVRVSMAYGGYEVVEYDPATTGHRSLSPGGHGTAREAALFLDGMLAAARLMQEA